TATYSSQPSDPPFVGVLLGNGDGFFAAPAYYGTGAFPRSVAIGDLNGDDKPDVVVANQYSNTVSVLLGNGDGSLGRKTNYGTGDGPSSVAIGDLNGDGKPDLAVANFRSGTVSVLRNTGGGITATLLAQFDAMPRDDGVELRWS